MQSGPQIDGMTAAYQLILGGLVITVAAVLIQDRYRLRATSREATITKRPTIHSLTGGAIVVVGSAVLVYRQMVGPVSVPTPKTFEERTD